jgi:hypothetical protein
MGIPNTPAACLDRLEGILRQNKDSLCWALVEDLDLCHSELLLHQLPESLALISAARKLALEESIGSSTVAAWLEGPDLMRSVFRVLSAAIAGGNEQIWLGLPKNCRQFVGLLQLLFRPAGLGIHIIPHRAEPFIESVLGQVHTLLVQGEPRWIEGWESVFARWGMRVHFEGPGHDAILIFEGADPEHAATLTLEAALRNSGRDPSAPHRIYISHAVFSATTRALMGRSKSFQLGAPQDARSDLGPLPEAEIRQLLERMEQAVSDGALVQCGGEARVCTDGGRRGMEPTILTGCRSDMALVSEPSRGPLLALIGFDSPSDGIRMATRLRGGHSVSILGTPPADIYELRAHFGRVFLQTTPMVEARYGARLRWGADARSSWIWEPMPDGRLARRAGAHCLVQSVTPREARSNLPGVHPVSDEVRSVQGMTGPDGLIMLPD